MTISIIVPVYNSAKYLHRCIDSIISQTYSDWELILVNDGSTDNSSYICNEYAKTDNRIKVIEKENSGQFFSRLVGIKRARGEYVLFIDSDDVISEQYINDIFASIKKHNCDVLCWRIREVMGNESEESSEYVKEKMSISDFIIHVERESNNSLCNKAIRRKLFDIDQLEKAPSVRMAEDYMMMATSICKTDFVYFENSIFYVYIRNEQSVSYNISFDNLYDHLVVEQYVMNILSTYDFFSNEIEKEEYISLLNNIGKRLKLLLKNKTLLHEDFKRIRKHDMYIKSVSVEKSSYFKKDIFAVLKMARWNLYLFMKIFYGLGHRR